MARLILPRHPNAGAGVAVTFQGDAPNQGVYWEVVSVDPVTGTEGLGRGMLKWERTRTDGAGLTVNYYFAPSYEGSSPPASFDRIRVKVVA